MKRILFIIACIVVGESIAALIEWSTFRGWEHVPQPGTLMAALYMPCCCLMAPRIFRR